MRIWYLSSVGTLNTKNQQNFTNFFSVSRFFSFSKTITLGEVVDTLTKFLNITPIPCNNYLNCCKNTFCRYLSCSTTKTLFISS